MAVHDHEMHWKIIIIANHASGMNITYSVSLICEGYVWWFVSDKETKRNMSIV